MMTLPIMKMNDADKITLFRPKFLDDGPAMMENKHAPMIVIDTSVNEIERKIS